MKPKSYGTPAAFKRALDHPARCVLVMDDTGVTGVSAPAPRPRRPPAASWGAR